MASAYIDLCLALVNRVVEAETCCLRNRLEDRETELAAVQEEGPEETAYERLLSITGARAAIDRMHKEAHEQQNHYDELLRQHNGLSDALQIERRARQETQLEIDCAVKALRSALGYAPLEGSLPGTLLDLIGTAEQKVRERENAYDRLLALVGSTREPVGRPLLMAEVLDLVEGKILRGREV